METIDNNAANAALKDSEDALSKASSQIADIRSTLYGIDVAIHNALATLASMRFPWPLHADVATIPNVTPTMHVVHEDGQMLAIVLRGLDVTEVVDADIREKARERVAFLARVNALPTWETPAIIAEHDQFSRDREIEQSMRKGSGDAGKRF